MEKLLLTRKEAADALSISVDTLDQLRKNEIPSVYIGARVFVTPDALIDFVKRLEDS